ERRPPPPPRAARAPRARRQRAGARGQHLAVARLDPPGRPAPRRARRGARPGETKDLQAPQGRPRRGARLPRAPRVLARDDRARPRAAPGAAHRTVSARLAIALALLAALAPRARAGEEDVALLASAACGDERVLKVAASGAVAPVISFVLAHVAPEATSALALPEADRAALLRAENALSRMGRPAVAALADELARAEGARRQVLARALGRASVRSLRDGEAARLGARALCARATVLVEEHLLFSGRTSEPELAPELLPSLLGALAPPSLSALAELARSEETRPLAVRALADASGARDEAASLLDALLAKATAPGERARIGRALSELGGEAAVLALERALQDGPPDEACARLVDIEGTRDPGMAPRVLARALPKLAPEDQARALEALSVCALPPPPPPKARFVFDPHARRRTKDAKEARALGRAAALERVVAGPPSVRRAAARTLEALGRPEAMKDQQALAHRLLEAFERETVLAVSCEEARALVVLAPAEVLAPAFRAALDRALGGDAPVKAPREPVDVEARDRFLHAALF